MIETWLVTTDGTRFKCNYSNYDNDAAEKANSHQINITGNYSGITKYSRIEASDGTVFEGEHNQTLKDFQAHEDALDIDMDAQDLAGIFYPGEMSKEEYTEHIKKNLHVLAETLKELIDRDFRQ